MCFEDPGQQTPRTRQGRGGSVIDEMVRCCNLPRQSRAAQQHSRGYRGFRRLSEPARVLTGKQGSGILSNTLAVVIASTGRPDSLAKMIRSLAAQSRPPDRVIFSVVSAKDLPEAELAEPIEVLIGPRGLPRQRNTALAMLGDSVDLIVFYDDDFVPSRFALERIEAFFDAHGDVVGAGGQVLADGINTAGIQDAEADALIAAYDREPQAPPLTIRRDVYGLYGCNMVYRTRAIGAIRFDERLALYGWQEDIDFAAQLLGRGRIVKTFAFAGVHQGLKGGRSSGVRLGYSQVINPLYLSRKGTMRPAYARKIIRSNVVANLMRMWRPEPWADRRGRVKGNLIGMLDFLRGRLTPERIETL